jgi:hypothetical protein
MEDIFCSEADCVPVIQPDRHFSWFSKTRRSEVWALSALLVAAPYRRCICFHVVYCRGQGCLAPYLHARPSCACESRTGQCSFVSADSPSMAHGLMNRPRTLAVRSVRTCLDSATTTSCPPHRRDTVWFMTGRQWDCGTVGLGDDCDMALSRSGDPVF